MRRESELDQARQERHVEVRHRQFCDSSNLVIPLRHERKYHLNNGRYIGQSPKHLIVGTINGERNSDDGFIASVIRGCCKTHHFSLQFNDFQVQHITDVVVRLQS